ncbi:MAG TPA: hypothetical protein DCG37_06475 [Lachnospiraceae bacterium]|nr:hypothetical protein [Lachnospiraceae bacterium]
MKPLFTDNRAAGILRILGTKSGMSVAILAQQLAVSERTIRNDIRQLNEDLRGCARIEGVRGKYSLRIFDPGAYKKAYEKICNIQGMFGTMRGRQNYVFGELMRANAPLLTDELAYEMNVGRTTLVSDLKKLREELSGWNLGIVGKTSKGMILHGSELNIRNYVLETCFEAIYGDYPLDDDVRERIRAGLEKKPFEKQVGIQFERYMTVMLDRFLTGHFIGRLSNAYYNLAALGEFENLNSLVDDIGRMLHVDFPVEEKIFAFLPIAGMRTPVDLAAVQEIELSDQIYPLSKKIMKQIREELDISIDPRDFTEEFAYHLMFMLNRLRFNIRQPNALLDELRAKFPLAYEMSNIAARVIEREENLKVTEDERGHLTTYFGVFLEENHLGQKKPFRIAVICGTGRVTARLISVQLKKILDSQVEIQTMSDATVEPASLEAFDVILTTVELPFTTKKPVIRIREIFDEQELRHKLEKARYWSQIEIPVLDDNQYILSSLLDEDLVFFFEEGRSYPSALDEMIEILLDEGKIDEGFRDRLLEREEKGSMVYDNGVAIPHGIQTANDRMLLAIGIFESPAVHKEHSVRIIFFMALPETSDNDEMLMIRVYDELLEISRDESMLTAISATRTYPELMRVLYKKA